MVAAQCRTTGAPGPLNRACTDRWRAGAVITLGGERDRFFPPGRLGPATRSRLDTSLDVIPGVGHLSAHEAPETVARRVLRMLSSSGA
jgi:pimeloyl-ACP methyl ester carboxylesterase